jgi:tRNA (cytidine/uridine-2'-O-)-methyltransferase
MLKIALYQPEIAGNVGTIIRSCVCFGSELHIIKPCGFPLDLKRIKKSALDYIDHAKIIIHPSFEDFYQFVKAENMRLVLLSSKAREEYQNFSWQDNDMLLFGKESAGVSDEVTNLCDEKITITMKNNMRCLNLAVTCGIVLARASLALA